MFKPSILTDYTGEDSEDAQLERNDSKEDNEEHEFDDDWVMCYEYIMWLLVLLFSCLCNNIMILLWKKFFIMLCVFNCSMFLSIIIENIIFLL